MTEYTASFLPITSNFSVLLHKSHILLTFITPALIKVLLYYVAFILFKVAVISFSPMNLGTQAFSFTTKNVTKKDKAVT